MQRFADCEYDEHTDEDAHRGKRVSECKNPIAMVVELSDENDFHEHWRCTHHVQQFRCQPQRHLISKEGEKWLLPSYCC